MTRLDGGFHGSPALELAVADGVADRAVVVDADADGDGVAVRDADAAADSDAGDHRTHWTSMVALHTNPEPGA